jgi:uncharacterized protein involved in exopolysaccharide biosynthesis
LRKKIAAAAAAPPAAVTGSAPTRGDSPAMQDLKARIRSADVAIQAKRAEQAQLEQQIRAYQGRIQSSPQVEEQFKELTRDTQSSQALYDKLRTQMEQSQMTTDLENRQEGETFSVLDAPNLPTEPMFPKVPVFAGGGVAGGLFVGLLIVGLIEYKDTALRSERDVWAFTQLPTLAVIAWSGDIAHSDPASLGPKKGPFSRKPPKDMLADAPG